MSVPSDRKRMLRRLRDINTATGPAQQILTHMASAGGWVMYRVVGCAPQVMSRHEWDKLERLP